MKRRHALLGALSCAAGARAFDDPLNTPAPTTRLLTRTQLGGVARAGRRLVAVGIRGLVIVSDDDGRQWRQVPAPLASDLLAVQFVTPLLGWIAGHDGVVLHSADGGLTWARQLDGDRVRTLLQTHFTARAAQGDDAASAALRQLTLDYANGPEQPFLDIAFESPQRGFASGAFGLLLRTEDGGAHWQSWIERIDMPVPLHLNAVRRIGGRWYAASERGTVFRCDDARKRFVAMPTGYAGSFFGIVGDARQVIAFGLRGTACRSLDAGATWQRLATGLGTSLSAGALLADGRIVLASQGGQLIVSRDEGAAFGPPLRSTPSLLSGVCETADGALLAVGLGGVQRVALA